MRASTRFHFTENHNKHRWNIDGCAWKYSFVRWFRLSRSVTLLPTQCPSRLFRYVKWFNVRACSNTKNYNDIVLLPNAVWLCLLYRPVCLPLVTCTQPNDINDAFLLSPVSLWVWMLSCCCCCWCCVCVFFPSVVLVRFTIIISNVAKSCSNMDVSCCCWWWCRYSGEMQCGWCFWFWCSSASLAMFCGRSSIFRWFLS